MRRTSFLLLVLAFTLLIAQPSNRNQPRSVSVENSSIQVPNDYPHIQDAVDAAAAGDTILVAAGTYPENLTISKPLTLKGSGSDSATIDAGGRAPAIIITGTANVIVTGFTLLNPDFLNSTLLVKNSKNVTISRNSIFDGQYGISLINSLQTLADRNLVQRNYYGISIEGGSNNRVLNNTVSLNSVNISISDSSANTILNNVLSNSQGGIDLIAGSTRNNITENQIARNNDTGLYLEGSQNNIFSENLIAYTHDPANSAAVGITFTSASGNRFYRNNILSNDRQVFANNSQDLVANSWDDGTRGNFWDDYRGVDDGSTDPRTGLPRIAGDGIGDTLIPHPCPQGGPPCSLLGAPSGVDWMPLMNLWSPRLLVVAARADLDKGYPPLQVAFTGLASGGKPPYFYSWNLGDGGTSHTQNVTHTFQRAGVYDSTLTVTDSEGIVATDSFIITVDLPLGNIVLVVVDEAGLPLAGARVTSVLVPAGQDPVSGTTNNLGKSPFTQVLAGMYTFQATSAGFSNQDGSTTVTPGQTTTLTIMLRHEQGVPLEIYLAIGSLSGVIAGVGAVVIRRQRKIIGRRLSPPRQH